MTVHENDKFFENRCLTCRGYASCFTHALNKSELIQLQNKLSTKVLNKDHVLFYENKGAGNIYRILEGDIKLVYENTILKPVIVNVAHTLDYLGLEAILLDSSYYLTATAICDSVLCVIPKQVIDEYLLTKGDVCKKIYIEIQKEKERNFKFSILLLSGSSEAKLSYALLTLCDKNNIIKNSKEDIALMIGLRRETVSRLLRKLKTKNLIESNRRFIKIINRKGIGLLSQNIKNDSLS